MSGGHAQGGDVHVVLVDDHALFRAGFKLLVLRELGDTTTVTEVASAEAGLAMAGAQTPDLIFLDLGLPQLGGLDGLQAFQQAFPTAGVVVVSGVLGQDTVDRALQAGAVGYLPKAMDANTMGGALRDIVSGKVFAPGTEAGCDSTQQSVQLTQRQMDVLRELCNGQSNKQIARTLDMSDNTVRVHLHAILRELRVDSRTAAAVKAKAQGLF